MTELPTLVVAVSRGTERDLVAPCCGRVPMLRAGACVCPCGRDWTLRELLSGAERPDPSRTRGR